LRKQWFQEKRRTRMVAADRLADFHAAVMALPNAVMRDVILLQTFTGLRSGESTSLRWDDIDFAKRLIKLPASATKADRACELPMSDAVFDLLVARRALGKDRYVFPGPGKSGHVTYLQHAFDDIAEQTGIAVSPHDLRRGFATTANRIKVPLPLIKQLLNHAPSKDVTEGYVIVELEELREATQKIANELKRLCGIETPASENVTKLARK
jgi:integrase